MKIKFKQDKKTILQILKHAGIKKKIKIIDKLNGINERDSINILIRILEDQSWVMREKAAYRLANFGNRVIPRLRRLLNKGFWYTRASACIALGEIGNLKTLTAITKLYFFDENPTVKKEALTALIKMAKKEPLEFINKLRDMSIKEPEVINIFIIVGEHDAELKNLFEEEMGHEQPV